MFVACISCNSITYLSPQGYHRDLLEHWSPPPPDGVSRVHPPPPVAVINENPNTTSPGISADSIITNIPVTKVPNKRGRDRMERHHRKIITGTRDAGAKQNFV